MGSSPQPYKLSENKMKWLTPKEIQDRLDKFNETNDWSVFHDVPPEQEICVMYPHRFTFSEIKVENIIKELK